MNQKAEKQFEEKLEQINKDINFIKNCTCSIKDYLILSNPEAIKNIIKDGLSNSERKAKILLSCSNKLKSQKQIGESTGITKNNVSTLVSELIESGLLTQPLKIDKEKLIETSFLCKYQYLIQVISEIFDNEIAKKLIETKW